MVSLALQNSLEIGQGLVDPADVTLGHHEIQSVVCDAFAVPDLANVTGNLDGEAPVVMSLNPDWARVAEVAYEASACAVEVALEVPSEEEDPLPPVLLASFEENYLEHALGAVHEMEIAMIEDPVIHPNLNEVDVADLMEHRHSMVH